MFLAVDKDGTEWIYDTRPEKGTREWRAILNSELMEVPKGTIQRLLNYPLTWDDEAEEIVEYKDKDLKEDKMIKQNIKMRVTPEQSKKVQEICFANGIYLVEGRNEIQYDEQNYLFIVDEFLTSSSSPKVFASQDEEEIDADLFIRTNGTCEDTTLNDYDIDFADEEYTKLEKKVFKLKKQLEKHAIKIGNQKEEITRLLSYKERLQQMLMMPCKSVDNDNLVKELKEKDTIIKYLESKLYN